MTTLPIEGALAAAGLLAETLERLKDYPEPEPRWNRCDTCGKYIPYADFGSGLAVRSHGDSGYVTRCKKHNHGRAFSCAEEPATPIGYLLP